MTFLRCCFWILAWFAVTSVLLNQIEHYVHSKNETDFRDKFCKEVVRAKLAPKCYTQSLVVTPESK